MNTLTKQDELENGIGIHIELDNKKDFLVDWNCNLGDKPAISRADCKRNGGKIYAQWNQSSEMVKQLWKDKDGQYWYGNDWYSDNDAIVYPTYYCPF